jgi:hypothetical protein
MEHDFRFTSHQKERFRKVQRMHSRTLLARIERAEQLTKMKTNFSADCICWPDNEYPFFGFDIEREIASRVKCSVHESAPR